MPNNARLLQKLHEETKNDTENLPDPDILARDIAENLESALEQFKGIFEDLEEER
jgi:type I restriction enzyme M protein